jgi:hypothetical protein
MAYVVRRFWGCFACVYAACWSREDFGEGYFFAGGVFRGEVVEVGADETAVQSCCYVVWMAFYFLVSLCKERSVRGEYQSSNNNPTS